MVKAIRNPGPGMNKFNEATIADKEAKLIGAYVLISFRLRPCKYTL